MDQLLNANALKGGLIGLANQQSISNEPCLSVYHRFIKPRRTRAIVKIPVGQQLHVGGNLQYTVERNHRLELPFELDNLCQPDRHGMNYSGLNNNLLSTSIMRGNRL